MTIALKQSLFPFMNTFTGAELAETGGGTLIPVQQSKYDQKAMESIASGDSKFLPRLQLLTARSTKVSVDGFPANHFALFEGQDIKDVGDSVDILLIAWRPKALDIGGEDIISCYDPKFNEDNQPTGVFADIQKRSTVPDSGCMYGPEYLVYIPSIKKYATFFCGSITLRFEVPAFNGRLGNAATLRAYLIKPKKKKKGNSDPYFSTKVYDCTTVFDLPEQAEIAKQSEAFLNPKDEGPEGTTEEEAASTGRAQ